MFNLQKKEYYVKSLKASKNDEKYEIISVEIKLHNHTNNTHLQLGMNINFFWCHGASEPQH